MPAIPKRHDELAVAKYERTIRDLCTAWPNPIVVDPAPLSLETFRCRFRDAMKGVLEYKQGPDDLVIAVGMLSEAVLCAEREGGLLWIGPKSRAGRRAQKPVQPGMLIAGMATLMEAEKPVESPDSAIIRAIAVLCAAHVLSNARISGVAEEFIWASFPEDYEGGVLANDDGTFTIY